MQNAVQLIRNEEFDKIRVVIIGDEVWFVAVDVCRVLGLKNARKAVSKLDDDEKKNVDLNTVTNSYGISDAVSQGWIDNTVNIVNESGLYSLIFMSRKPNAKKFRKWVTSEVLPSIRKYGYYKVENFDDSQEFIPEKLKPVVEFAKQNNLEYEFEIFEEIVNGEKVPKIGMNTISNGKKHPVYTVIFDE